MIAPVAVKVTTRIDSELAVLLLTIPRYLEETDPLVLGWLDELAKALPAGKKDAFLTMASVYHLTGDLRVVEAMFERARTNGATEGEIDATGIPIYLNLGYPSRAAVCCRSVVSIRQSNLTVGLPSAVSTGAFQFVGELLEQARMANLDLNAIDQIEDIRAMAAAAASFGFSDEDYGKVLDIAGAVLREERMFWLEAAPQYHFDEDMQILAVRFLIDVSPEAAAVLSGEVSRRIVGAALEGVPLSVAFKGVAETAEA